MSNQVFNIALGRDVQLAMNVNANTPANSAIVVLLLKANEADDTLNNHATLATLLAAAGNTECDATGYARLELTDTSSIAVTVNNATNKVHVDIPDQIFPTLGGTLDNTLTKCVFCYDPDTTTGTDADLIPLYHFDISAPNNVTNGNNFQCVIDANGLLSQ